MIVRVRGSGKVKRGILAVGTILGLALGLAVLARIGQPRVIRRPDAVVRPVLLVADIDNRTGQGGLQELAYRITETIREQLQTEPDGIFEVSPRRLRPVLDEGLREDGLVAIAARLGADYVLAGSLETGPGEPLGPGSRWPAGEDIKEDAVRLDVLLVRDAEPPEVFAERLPLGQAELASADADRIARIVAGRIALSLRRF